MKTTTTLRMVAMLFIIITAVLLILTIFNIIDSEATKDAITKTALLCGVIAGSSLGISFLSKK